MRLFGSERLITMFNALGVPEGQEITHKMVSNANLALTVPFSSNQIQ